MGLNNENDKSIEKMDEEMKTATAVDTKEATDEVADNVESKKDSE